MRKVIVFSGAGMSADSGIPTFRGTDGLWEQHKVEDVAEYEAWWRDKELVLRFYQERYAKYSPCKPHEGHYALAKLEEKFDVTHVTQNIDDLLEQAGCTDVVHLHGKINRRKCEWHKDISTLDGDRRHVCDYKAEVDAPVQIGELCPKCGGQLRPDVVWFNEAVHLSHKDMKSWLHHVKYGPGVFICCGTSVQVYPAGYLVSFFSQVQNKYIVDPKPQKIGDYTLLEGTAREKLPELVEKLLNESEDAASPPAPPEPVDDPNDFWRDLMG